MVFMALFILDKTDRAAVMPLGKPLNAHIVDIVVREVKSHRTFFTGASTGPIATYFIHYISTVLLIIRNVYITGLGQDENTGILHRREVFRGICDGLRASTLKKGRFCTHSGVPIRFLEGVRENEQMVSFTNLGATDCGISVPGHRAGGILDTVV